MNTPFLLLSLLLVAVSGAQAQSLPADVGSLPVRPQNLSQRPARAPLAPALIAPEQAAQAVGQTSEQAAQAPGQAPEQAVTPLRYGAGFEARQLGGTPGSNAAGAGRSGSGSGGSGGSGNGGGGRGGSGRGR